MTLPTSQLEGLVDPEQTAFFANSSPTQDDETKRHLEESAIGLAAAFIVLRNLMSKELQRQHAVMGSDVPNLVARAWKRITPFWLKVAIPALKQAYSLGSTQQLTDDQLTMLATDYADNLGVYINATSAEALTQGFNDQLREKWSERVAWMRATEAYGLDKHQMKTYVKQVMSLQPTNQELVPLVARVAVDKAMLMRAEKLGDNEAFHASKLGQSMVWMIQQKSGQLPIDAEKEWITADDERVCAVCGPLHHKRVKLDEQWLTVNGEKVWAPGIHPRCRCEVRLIYPEITNDTWSVVEKNQPGDEYDRDRRGRFARTEQRRGFRPVAEPVRDAAVDQIMEEARQLAEETTEQVVSPFGDVSSPFTATQSPFSETTSPFAQASPFAQTQTPFNAESPFAKPERRKRRTVLIFAPGETEPVETEIEAGDEELEQGPYWTFWNSVREADPQDYGNPWGEIRDTGSRNDELSVGQIINFDFHVIGSKRPDPAVVANEFTDPPHKLAEMAAEHYSDINRWTNDPDADASTEDYNEAYLMFHEAATSNMEMILARLQDSEVREIFRGGSVRDQQMADSADPSELREIIDINKDSQMPLVDSALRYIEKVLPERFDLQEAVDYGFEHVEPSAVLLDSTRNLEYSWVPVPHVPTILVFDRIVGDVYRSYQGITSRVVRGQYRVKSVEETNANFHYIGDVIERPKNLAGWKIVHLEPVDPEEEVVPDIQRDYQFGWDRAPSGE